MSVRENTKNLEKIKNLPGLKGLDVFRNYEDCFRAVKVFYTKRVRQYYPCYEVFWRSFFFFIETNFLFFLGVQYSSPRI